MLLVWAVTIGGMVFLVRWLGREAVIACSSRQDSALAILKEPYARGEIGEEEFERLRAELRRA